MAYLRIAQLVTTEGEILRTMNIRDGYAMKVAVESGYNVCIISGGSNDVRLRLRIWELQIFIWAP
jgi:3-deoxy-D-manno-octulosonate 8-phosphate phosphatase (KDO 8-P phosphatase)